MTDLLKTVFVTPFSSIFFIGNTLDYMALLIPAALGAALAFRAGLSNLGIESQIYFGALASSAFLLAIPEEAARFSQAVLPAAALIAMLAGAFLAVICAALKAATGANELITSFLLGSGITPVIDYIITGPLRDGSGNLLATAPIPPEFLLRRILPPSSLSVSLFPALCLPVAAYVFLNMTASGYRFRLVGNSPDFARYGGITAERYQIPAFGFSGALAGLAGFFAVAGTYGVLHQGLPGGLGWAGIACALIGRSRSLAVLPAALFYAYLKSGADTALLVSGRRFESSSLIQAAVLFAATIRAFRTDKAGTGKFLKKREFFP